MPSRPKTGYRGPVLQADVHNQKSNQADPCPSSAPPYWFSFPNSQNVFKAVSLKLVFNTVKGGRPSATKMGAKGKRRRNTAWFQVPRYRPHTPHLPQFRA